MRKAYLLILIFIYLLVSPIKAQEEGSIDLFHAKGYNFPYDLLSPRSTIKLPTQLREISGLDYINDERFAAIQDEKGKIFIIDFKTGKIEQEIHFADDGDYEGIAIVNDDAWVLKSKGDLYRVKDFLDDKERKVKKYETDLSKINDLEGLCYDPINKRLLIAAKGHPFIDSKGGEHSKAIYSFDLKEKVLSTKPVYLIDLEEIKYYRKYNTMTRLGIELMATFDSSKGDVTFQPSDLAIHPVTGYIYVIGSVGDLLIVLHPSGEILAMLDLDDKLFNQPEGICFGPNAELYISNEAGEKAATILKYLIQN